MSAHIIPFPFPLKDSLDGGLPTVLIDEARRDTSVELHFLTADRESGEHGGHKLTSATPTAVDDPSRFDFWFRTGAWTDLHPLAFSPEATHPDALKYMYAPFRTLPRTARDVHIFTEQHAVGAEAHAQFNSRFVEPLSGMLQQQPPRAVNWQDFFFEPLVRRFADELRTLGVFQTFHLHTALPETLHHSHWGRKLIESMCKVDVVYFHTDTYIRRFLSQVEALGLKAPEVRRFDLGIDRDYLDRAVSDLGDGNLSLVTGYDSLPEKAKALVSEAFRSRNAVPHRFAVIDRIDPGKDFLTVLRAIDTFLNARIESGAGIDDLKRNFRFFLLASGYGADYSAVADSDLKGRYQGLCQKELRALEEKYPGIVFASDALTGSARVLIPAVIRGCHGITGGSQDGLNLAVMESLWVNRDIPVSFLCGQGAGFSIRMREEKQTDQCSLNFTVPGSVDSMVQGLISIVETQRTMPLALLRSKEGIISAVANRMARMAVPS